MNFLKKIQNLPEGKRKIILWVLIIIIGVLFVSFFINNSKKKFSSYDQKDWTEGLNLPNMPDMPNLGEELKKIPNIELLDMEMPSTTAETSTQPAGETAGELPAE